MRQTVDRDGPESLSLWSALELVNATLLRSFSCLPSLRGCVYGRKRRENSRNGTSANKGKARIKTTHVAIPPAQYTGSGRTSREARARAGDGQPIAQMFLWRIYRNLATRICETLSAFSLVFVFQIRSVRFLTCENSRKSLFRACRWSFMITEAQEISFMLSKITLAVALAIAAFTTIVPASAAPGDFPYPPGYEDMAYNRTGW
jgi:hypothetical protein